MTGELDGKLDSKTAKVGDRVVLKTMDKVQTSDGTVIPRGSRLVGHVTEVQAYDPEAWAGANRDCIRSRGAEKRPEHCDLHADSGSEPGRSAVTTTVRP